MACESQVPPLDGVDGAAGVHGMLFEVEVSGRTPVFDLSLPKLECQSSRPKPLKIESFADSPGPVPPVTP